MRLMNLVLCVLLASCGGDRNDDARTADVPKAASPSPVAQSVRPTGDELPRPDRSKPLNEYVDINSDPMTLTYVVTSKSKGSLGDEEKLNRFSPAYFREQDAFKKRELAQRELPRISEELRKYITWNYFSVPVGASGLKLGAATPVQIANVVVGDYDFATKAFALQSYAGAYCWSVPVRNEQGAALRVVPSDFPCSVPIPDEAQAKVVESARTQGALDLQGTLYLFVPRAEDGVAQAIVAHAHLEFVHANTNEVLARFDW